MSSFLRPMRAHGRGYWLVPDSRLGRLAGGVFVAALLLGLSFPVVTPLLERLTGADMHDTPFVTPIPYAAILAGVSGVMAIVALVRDHAALLLIPALFGTLAGLVFLGEVLVG